MTKKYLNFLFNGLFKKAPVQLTLFVTAKCTLRCKMCFYWEPIESPAKDEITLEEVERISGTFPRFFWLLIGGGEPFIRRDLPQIIQTFYKNNGIRHVTIPTNGTCSEQIAESTEKILQLCPGIFLNLNLSLNGLGDAHDELCQSKDVFRQVLTSYERMIELKKRYRNLGVGINITHSGYNQHATGEIIDFIAARMNEADNISVSMVRGRPKDGSSLNADLELYKRAVEKIEALAVQRRLRAFQMPFGGLALAKDMLLRRVIAQTMTSGYQIPCFAGRISLVIDERANVYPCEMLPSVGNLRDHNLDISTILNGTRLALAVKKIKCENCFCTHECFYNVNILFNPSMWPALAYRYLSFRSRQWLSKRDNGAFDDIFVFSNKKQKSYPGQQGGLYEGGNFAQLTADQRKAEPVRPF